MDINAYQPCPCHADRKIKFCCGKQIVADLNEVMSLAQARQTVAALDRLDRLIASEGEKDCLLTLKTHFCLNLMEIDKARECNERFLEKNPKHPVGMQHRALANLAENKIAAAIECLQDAMDGVKGSTVPISIANAYRLVGLELLRRRAPIAARAHLGFARSLRPDDQETTGLLLNSYRLPLGSLMYKHDLLLPDPPAEPLWSRTYLQVRRLAIRGQWRTALQYIELKMLPQHSQEPVLLRAIAILALWLNRIDRAISAWRAYADCPGLAADDAVEAELWISLLSPAICTNKLEAVHHVAEIRDLQQALSLLQDWPRAIEVPLPPADNEQPAPKIAYAVLDRDPNENANDLTIDNIPRVITEFYVYGRQTDRPARLEFHLVKGDQYDSHRSLIRKQLGETTAIDQATTQVTHQIEEQSELLNWYWHLPPDVSKQRLAEMEREKAVQVLTQQWTRIPMVQLDNKTPADVAADPQYRARLSALICHFETAERNHPYGEDTANQLRQHLGLEIPPPLDPSAVSPRNLSPHKLLRIDWTKASDEDLTFCFFKSMNQMNKSVTERVGTEILQRESMKPQLPFEDVHTILASITAEDDAALEHMRLARKIAVSKNKSPGLWLVAELELRLSRNIMEKTEELFEEIQTRHMNEPEVEVRMSRLMASVGIYDTAGRGDETPTAGMEGAAATEPTEADGGELLSPISDPQKTASGSPGKLWLPGDEY